MAWDSTPLYTTNYDSDADRIAELALRFTARDKTIKPTRSDLDVVYEIMLKLGVHLDYIVSEITVGERKCYSIGAKTFETSQDCLLLVCLDYGITGEDIIAMADLAPAQIIAAEEAFKDSSATSNAYYILKNREIDIQLI